MLNKLLFVIVLTFLSSLSFATSNFPWPASYTGTQIPLGPGHTNFEASGVVYDPSTKKLYVVDDGGWVVSMTPEGRNLSYYNFNGKPDLEAVATTGTGSGFVYVGHERKKKGSKKKPEIWELYTSNLQPTGRKWRLLNIATNDGYGMEGLTWVPNGMHPYTESSSGGLFYAGSQYNGYIYVYDVDLHGSGNRTELYPKTSFKPDINENKISDLYFDTSQKILYVLYADARKLVEFDIVKRKKRYTYNLPRAKLEGVTLLPNCPSGTTKIYLASDIKNKGVYLFNDFPVICPDAPNNAAFVAQSVPNEMIVGKKYSVSIKLRNIGNASWTKNKKYQLGSQSPQGNSTWGPKQDLQTWDTIYRDQEKNFKFTVVAPSVPGTYNFQWRMTQGSNWFGHLTPSVSIVVADPSRQPPPDPCREDDCEEEE